MGGVVLRRASRIGAALTALAATLVPAERAEAYTFQSAVSDGCHERITERVLDTLRESTDLWPRLPLGPGLAPVAQDLPFELAAEHHDLGGITLVMAVRDVDLKGNAPTDASELALVHGDPELQEEHCLRHSDDDEPDGSRRAVARCADFLRTQALAAVDALDAEGRPDAEDTAPLRVELALRGPVTLRLPRYYLALGTALHTLQDAFSHTLRSDDGMTIHTVLNWVEDHGSHRDERTDGPGHSRALDDCEAHDPLRRRRRELSIEASIELALATIDPSLDRDEKELAIDAVVTRYVSYVDEGCTADDRWCDAPELRLDEPCFCAAPGAPTRGGAGTALVAAALGVLAWRRRSRGRSVARRVVAASLVATALAAPRTAAADEPVTIDEVASAPSAASRFGFASTFGISVENPAIALSLGARYRLARAFSVGLEAEWNPWATFQADVIRPGAANLSALGVVHWDVGSTAIWLRTRAHVGASVLLFDLYEAPAGSVGPYLRASLLGVEWRIAENASIVVDPADVAVAIPQPYGLPFVYHQHRASVSIEVGGFAD